MLNIPEVKIEEILHISERSAKEIDNGWHY